ACTSQISKEIESAFSSQNNKSFSTEYAQYRPWNASLIGNKPLASTCQSLPASSRFGTYCVFTCHQSTKVDSKTPAHNTLILWGIHGAAGED
ncbi:MAG: hypothetical protein V7703_18420, partial [Hyphomicrobiales bacterium]